MYEQLSPGDIWREIIQGLVKGAMPCAGFESGCIFMIEPYSMTLQPMLKFGKANPDRMHIVTLSAADDSDPIGEAFKCSSPIKQDDQTPSGDTVSFIAGALGNQQKTGVLYVELGDRLESKASADPLLYFKALRQALCDSLNLS